MSPDAAFAYSQVAINGKPNFPDVHSIMPKLTNLRHDERTHRFYRLPPVPCKLSHSAPAWSVLHPFTGALRYRSLAEQRTTPRDLHWTRARGPCIADERAIVPADADMWQRVMAEVGQKRLTSVFVNVVDVAYSADVDKANLRRMIAKLQWPCLRSSFLSTSNGPDEFDVAVLLNKGKAYFTRECIRRCRQRPDACAL